MLKNNFLVFLVVVVVFIIILNTIITIAVKKYHEILCCCPFLFCFGNKLSFFYHLMKNVGYILYKIGQNAISVIDVC